MTSATPQRAHFQQLADSVYLHASERDWPEISYQAAFTTVVQAGTDARRLEGNSVFWETAWDTESGADLSVKVASGEDAWRAFLEAALYPDLLRADEELRRR
jgi:hypothetical protein